VGLERGPLSLVSKTEELLDKKSSGSCLENREYGRRDPSRWPRGTFYPQKLAITSPTSGGRSVGIVRSRTQTMEFSFFYLCSRQFGPIALWDVEAPTFFRNSAHRWWWSCQPYTLASLFPRKIPGTHFC
jgi:hypothetical protein